VKRLAILVAAFLALGVPDRAGAQYFDDLSAGYVGEIGSAESWALELRGGPYQPEVAEFDTFFSTDNGPLLAFELDYLPFQLEDWFDAGIGWGFGWSQYVGAAMLPGGTTGAQSSEETSLTLYPMPVVGVIRIDALARQLRIPLLLTGKLGASFVFWNSGTGSRSDATDVSIGLLWAAQCGLELDIFSERAARSLDEVWGINHTFLFFELFGIVGGTTLPVGPKNGIAWSVGLGLQF
jgi:hypothetical protein